MDLTNHVRHPLRLATLGLLLAACVSGCQHPTRTTVDVAPAQYVAALDATRDVLRKARFEIDRVDGREGIVSAGPKATAGLATPWDAEQSTFVQEWEDFANQQRRRVVVRFEPADGSSVDSLYAYTGPIAAEVMVSVSRLHRDGWRLETESISQSSRSRDPMLRDRRMLVYEVTTSQDPKLAARLAARIQDELAVVGSAERQAE